MNHPLGHVLDTAIVAVQSITVAAAALLLNSPQPGDAEVVANTLELQFLLLPLIGSAFVSGGLIMLNPNPETRQVIIGRGIFALFFGVLIPQVLGLVVPSVKELSMKPAVLVLAGGVVAGFVFVVSKPFVVRLFEKSGGMAKRLADKVEGKISPPSEGG
jgi:Na+/phosphate symporter